MRGGLQQGGGGAALRPLWGRPHHDPRVPKGARFGTPPSPRLFWALQGACLGTCWTRAYPPLVPPSAATCAGALPAPPVPKRAGSSRASALKLQDAQAAAATVRATGGLGSRQPQIRGGPRAVPRGLYRQVRHTRHVGMDVHCLHSGSSRSPKVQKNQRNALLIDLLACSGVTLASPPL